MTDDAPFRSAEHALKFAYGMEARDIVKISSLFRQMRGSTVRGKGRFDGPWEAHCQAAMILAMVERLLDPRQVVCVATFYTIPSQPALELRKQTGYRLLADLSREVQPEAHHWFVVDVVREWAGDRRHHSDAWWARHLDVHRSRMTHIAMGRPERRQVGVVSFLNAMLATSVDSLRLPMWETGLVEE